VELGVGTFLLAGVGSSGVVGLSPFVTDSLSEAVFLRISVAVGESPQSVMRMTWAAGRLDTCLAVPGHYAERNGLRLDLCGGLDAGFTYISSATLPDAPHDGSRRAWPQCDPGTVCRRDGLTRGRANRIGASRAELLVEGAVRGETPPIRRARPLDSWLVSEPNDAYQAEYLRPLSKFVP
jgi:hypothetical protein